MSDLTQCSCYTSDVCHFCTVELEDEPVGDEFAWADYVLTIGSGRFHILAHAYCAEGQIGVERG
jgi:hypothetical protein